MKPRFKVPAWLELLEAAARYERERPGHGELFVDDVLQRYAILAENCFLGIRIDHEFRQFPLKDFPYSLVYRPSGERLVISGIIDGRRQLGYWREDTGWFREPRLRCG